MQSETHHDDAGRHAQRDLCLRHDVLEAGCQSPERGAEDRVAQHPADVECDEEGDMQRWSLPQIGRHGRRQHADDPTTHPDAVKAAQEAERCGCEDPEDHFKPPMPRGTGRRGFLLALVLGTYAHSDREVRLVTGPGKRHEHRHVSPLQGPELNEGKRQDERRLRRVAFRDDGVLFGLVRLVHQVDLERVDDRVPLERVRRPGEAQEIRPPGPPYTVEGDSIVDAFEVHLVGGNQAEEYAVVAESDAAEKEGMLPLPLVQLGPSEGAHVPVFVCLPRVAGPRRTSPSSAPSVPRTRARNTSPAGSSGHGGLGK